MFDVCMFCLYVCVSNGMKLLLWVTHYRHSVLVNDSYISKFLQPSITIPYKILQILKMLTVYIACASGNKDGRVGNLV